MICLRVGLYYLDTVGGDEEERYTPRKFSSGVQRTVGRRVVDDPSQEGNLYPTCIRNLAVTVYHIYALH